MIRLKDNRSLDENKVNDDLEEKEDFGNGSDNKNNSFIIRSLKKSQKPGIHLQEKRAQSTMRQQVGGGQGKQPKSLIQQVAKTSGKNSSERQQIGESKMVKKVINNRAQSQMRSMLNPSVNIMNQQTAVPVTSAVKVEHQRDDYID